jgi:hypothetical protein
MLRQAGNPFFSLLSFSVVCLVGCASVRTTPPKLNVQLSQFRRVHLELIDQSQSLPMPWNWPNLLWTTNDSRQRQVAAAANRLAASLAAQGFELVDRGNNPAAVASLEIDSVRFDPLAGWIADRASLSFRALPAGTEVARYEASGTLLTPTLDRLIDRIVDGVAADW